MKDFAAIDFETANQHRTSVCGVGVVIVREGRIVDSIYRLIKPYPDFYSYWNVKVHGITQRDTFNAPTFEEVWEEISAKIKDLPLVAHNKSFDESCLKKCHEFYGIYYPDYEFYCTLTASRRYFPHLPNHQLHTVSSYVGFDLKNHHHALADAEACAKIALRVDLK